MKKTILLGLAATALLTACSNDELITAKSNDADAITFKTFVNKSTRATTDITNANLGDYANGFSVYAYTNGDDDESAAADYTIGNKSWYLLLDDEHVYGSGTIDTNGDNSKWTYDRTQYWKAGNSYHFHAIAPYGDGSSDINTATNRQWTFKHDDTNLANGTITFTNIASTTDADNKTTETADGTQDLLYAYQTTVAQASNDEVKFTFSHLLSRVKFRFIGAETNPSTVTIKVTDVKITDTYDKGSIKIENTAASNLETLASADWTFDGATETAISFPFDGTDTFTTGTVETDHKYIIPYTKENTKVYHADITYILEAQVEANSDEVRTYKIEQTDVELPKIQMKKGFSYVYEVSVKTGNGSKPGDNNLIEPIVVNVQELEEWDAEEPASDDNFHTVTYGNITDKSQVQAYDYAMSDGSFVHLKDGESLTAQQQAHCIGVVFYTVSKDGPSLKDDDALHNDFPDCTHGLIVALHELKGVHKYNGFENGILWQGNEVFPTSGLKEYEDIWANFQKGHDIYDKAPYTSVQCNLDDLLDNTGMNIDEEKYNNSSLCKLLGYNNTQILTAYNQTSPKYPVNIITALTKALKDGTLNNYEGYSSWYIPSLFELEILCGSPDFTESNAVTINNALTKLDSTSYDTFKYYIYWSSTEDDEGLAYDVWLTDNGSFDQSTYTDK
jgi:hypothetical protein